jgi:8-oxo-dGTP pyrophosphatase MutT (NUDIX family)
VGSSPISHPKIIIMPHIHTQPNQHDQTTCAFIVRLDRPKPTIMLHDHKKLGKLLPFGGHIELDETPWQAITHELIEESGYEINQLQILQPKSRIKSLTGISLHPYPICYNTHAFDESGHYHTDAGFAFITNQDPMHPIRPGESDKIIEVDQISIRNYSESEMSENIKEICEFIFDEALSSWEAVDTKEFK